MRLSDYIDAYEEEKIAVLRTLCAILCFAYGFTFWAWVFTFKAATDNITAIYAAVRQGKEKKEKEA